MGFLERRKETNSKKSVCRSSYFFQIRTSIK
ncbi:hypothetical protein LSS_20835 [Leptospira santarosai serovar Shermani str. LT 821]|uniref:Uncharacterized protein n=1 Tax=Leptospira santarosai serovar Shermani str. LT 821 TaxID=758847 RepID=A0A097ESA0_9LEPT|nr:hypothetical protein LSS_20835 [Leptospira santarosai serovar Shermani str. LT 821]